MMLIRIIPQIIVRKGKKMFKKIIAMVVTVAVALSLTACSGGSSSPYNIKEIDGLSDTLKGTNTAKVISVLQSGTFTMEISSSNEGSIYFAVDGNKMYTKITVADTDDATSQELQTLVADGYMYFIDDETKTYAKIESSGSTDMPSVLSIDEEMLANATLTKETKTIDGKTYQTETMKHEDTSTTFCFDSDNKLAYISADEDSKVVIFSMTVDESLFKVPDGYTESTSLDGE